MSVASEPRKPRAFDSDDPSIVEEPVAAAELEAAAAEAAPTADDSGLARPTLADLGQRGLRWGTLLLSALAGAAVLGAAAWFARLVSAALVREDWVGWTTLVLLLVAAVAALMILLRELVGFSRLNRLNRIRTDVAKAIAERDPKRERRSEERRVGKECRSRWSPYH